MLKSSDKALNSYVIEFLEKKHINMTDLAENVIEVQGAFFDNLTIEECEMAISKVLNKREVLQPFATAIQIDKLASKHRLDEPLQTIIENDFGLYGVDETLAISMCNPYGTIAITTFGYLDKVKKSTAKKLDEEQKRKNGKVVNTFIDDCISALIADASALLAHNKEED